MGLIKRFLKNSALKVGSLLSRTILYSGQKRLVILMYHRILPKTDPRYLSEEPGMVVSPESFEMHLEQIGCLNATVVKINDWLQMDEATKPKLAFAITFDDGWLDNYEYAFPILKKYNLPSHVFSVTSRIGKASEFWPNRLLNILLNKEKIRTIKGTKLEHLLPEVPSEPLTKEEASSIINIVKNHSDQKIIEALDASFVDEGPIDMMSVEQLKKAQSYYNVEVGCHTATHLRLLTGITNEQLTGEIATSKDVLSELIGHDVIGFCYPNGDASEEAVKLVAKNYDYAVTTESGHNNSSALSNHQLKRIAIHDDVSNTVDKFKARIAIFPFC